MSERSDSSDWSEDASQDFIALGEIFTPSRASLFQAIASLIPASADEVFSGVELSAGAGLLTRSLLERFPRCRIIALDFSPAMLDEAKRNLEGYEERVAFRLFDLRRRDWLDDLPSDLRCFVSSLAIHHLDGAEKRGLFAELSGRLPAGGALLIADLVEPVNEYVRSLYASAWDDAVREQSLQHTGSLDAYRAFHEKDWNHFVTPDVEFDKPSGLFEQLSWLSEAGFSQVDCFWLRAGHAIYGGYK
jgi:trans-aconitate methyltransferase